MWAIPLWRVGVFGESGRITSAVSGDGAAGFFVNIRKGAKEVEMDTTPILIGECSNERFAVSDSETSALQSSER